MVQKKFELTPDDSPLEERLTEMEQAHIPNAHPCSETCFTCPVLLAGELRGGRLFALCGHCVALELKNKKKRVRNRHVAVYSKRPVDNHLSL